LGFSEFVATFLLSSSLVTH